VGGKAEFDSVLACCGCGRRQTATRVLLTRAWPAAAGDRESPGNVLALAARPAGRGPRWPPRRRARMLLGFSPDFTNSAAESGRRRLVEFLPPTVARLMPYTAAEAGAGRTYSLPRIAAQDRPIHGPVAYRHDYCRPPSHHRPRAARKPKRDIPSSPNVLGVRLAATSGTRGVARASPNSVPLPPSDRSVGTNWTKPNGGLLGRSRSSAAAAWFSRLTAFGLAYRWIPGFVQPVPRFRPWPQCRRRRSRYDNADAGRADPRRQRI